MSSPAIEPEQITLLVIAKEPLPGKAKTRLAPAVGREGASRLARAALEDTLAAVAALPNPRLLALDGEPGTWLPAGFEITPQRGTGLAERLASAFDDAGGPALLVGMDTPQIDSALLGSACARLARAGTDAVLGLATDGGWWALGLRSPDRRIFEGVPMSTAETGAMQRESLAKRGLEVADLPQLRDVDTIEDAIAVAAAAPRSRFARRLAASGVPLAAGVG